MPIYTMTNAAFTKLLRRTSKTMNAARALLRTAEEEYERRYGTNPSDVDDDMWIDSMHGAGGCSEDITAEDVDKGAVEYAGLESYITNQSQP